MNPVITDDGLALHLRVWPAGNPRRGLVVLVHGLGEHIDRYDHVARRLNGIGFDVVGYDLVDMPGVALADTVFESLDHGSE